MRMTGAAASQGAVKSANNINSHSEGVFTVVSNESNLPVSHGWARIEQQAEGFNGVLPGHHHNPSLPTSAPMGQEAGHLPPGGNSADNMAIGRRSSVHRHEHRDRHNRHRGNDLVVMVAALNDQTAGREQQNEAG
jgi:hypothetical protein